MAPAHRAWIPFSIATAGAVLLLVFALTGGVAQNVGVRALLILLAAAGALLHLPAWNESPARALGSVLLAAPVAANWPAALTGAGLAYVAIVLVVAILDALPAQPAAPAARTA